MDETMALQSKDVHDERQTRRDTHLRRWLPRFQYAWALHFIVTLSVIIWGIYANGGTRKYIPAAQDAFPSCKKAFINVLASSEEEPGAVVCCDGDNDPSVSSLCAPKPAYPPFGGRLAHFPDAWLLPLFPMVVRIVLTLIGRLVGANWDYEKPTTTLLRLCFYIVTLNYRGWVLYVGLSQLESLVVVPVGDECWFREDVKTPSCLGRIFDFSDHTVLYMAQILPLPLMETLQSLALPFWGGARGPGLCLVLCLVYLYAITLMGQFKTAAYFHTGGEILAGYLVSLSVQLPYALLQSYPIWEGMRLWLFGYPLAHARRDSSRVE